MYNSGLKWGVYLAMAKSVSSQGLPVFQQWGLRGVFMRTIVFRQLQTNERADSTMT